MGPAAAGARKTNVAAAAAAKTTTFHRRGWHILGKITVTINGLQSDLHPGGLSASREPGPRAPQGLVWTEWGRWPDPCGLPDGTRPAATQEPSSRGSAGSRFMRPGHGAPAGSRAHLCRAHLCRSPAGGVAAAPRSRKFLLRTSPASRTQALSPALRRCAATRVPAGTVPDAIFSFLVDTRAGRRRSPRLSPALRPGAHRPGGRGSPAPRGRAGGRSRATGHPALPAGRRGASPSHGC